MEAASIPVSMGEPQAIAEKRRLVRAVPARASRIWILSILFHVCMVMIAGSMAFQLVRKKHLPSEPIEVVKIRYPIHPLPPSLPAWAPLPQPREFTVSNMVTPKAPEIEFEMPEADAAEAPVLLGSIEVEQFVDQPHPELEIRNTQPVGAPAPVSSTNPPSTTTPPAPAPEPVIERPAAGSSATGRSAPGLARPLALVYPERQRKKGNEAVVELTVVLDARGQVLDVEVTSADVPPDFQHAALTAARAGRYKPALEGGHAVASRLSLRVRFELR